MLALLPKKEVFERLRNGVILFDIDGVQKIVKDGLDAGISPEEIVDVLRDGLQVVGRKYQAGEFFLTELIMAGELMKEVMKVIEPYFKEFGLQPVGKVVIGTAAGDIHDIGKNIVIALLKAAGFEVTDLGVDVPVSKFIEAAKIGTATGKCILGVSALLSVTIPEMEIVIKELKKADIRDHVKVIVGGALITDEFAKTIEADASCRDAVKGVNICKAWAHRG